MSVKAPRNRRGVRVVGLAANDRILFKFGDTCM